MPNQLVIASKPLAGVRSETMHRIYPSNPLYRRVRPHPVEPAGSEETYRTSPALTRPEAPDMSLGCTPHRARRYRKTASELARVINRLNVILVADFMRFHAHKTPGPVKSSCSRESASASPVQTGNSARVRTTSSNLSRLSVSPPSSVLSPSAPPPSNFPHDPSQRIQKHRMSRLRHHRPLHRANSP